MNRNRFFFIIIFSFLFSFAFAQENKKNSINGFMPEEILVTTNTQTFCKGFSFTLHDGKIWVKKDNQKEWSLFLETGLPHCEKKRNLAGSDWFKSAESVTEIYADGDAIFAFDNYNRMYRCYLQDTTADPPFAWLNNFGWPKKNILTKTGTIEGSISWGMGVRRKDILWYEDRYGNEHHYGTMGLETVYFLSKNGQEIRFTDSGLPCSPSKTILGPERGSFIAENMSVSGSTLFVINAAGQMYTRLIDYDTMGCDPMWFNYSYNSGKQKYTGKNYLSNYTFWALPNEEWAKQVDIPLSGKARLTKYISIFQNGQGNFARVLRVAGISDDGKIGYYEKSISEKEWTFIEADLNLSEESFLKYARPETCQNIEILKSLRGNKTEYSYSGYFYKDNTKIEGYSVSVSDFTLTTEGSCTLVITDLQTNEQKNITLYPLEMWSYLEQYNPGFDGTSRNYFVTPEFDSSDISSSNKEFLEILLTLFDKMNQSLYAYSASATTEYLEIDFKNSKGYKAFLTKEETTLPPSSFKAKSSITQSLIKDCDDESLILPKNKTYSILDAEEIINKIKNNESYIQLLDEDKAFFEERKKSATKSRIGFKLVDFLTTITLLNKVNFPKIKSITSQGATLLTTNAISLKSLEEYRAFIYPFVVKLVQRRISVYKNLLNNVSDGKKINGETLLVYNSYSEYFRKAELPESQKGYSPILNSSAEILMQTTLPFYAGIELFIECDNESHSLTIEIPDFIDHAFTEKPIICNANIEISSINLLNSDIEKSLRKIAKKKTIFEWDGKTITIYSKNKSNVLFKGNVLNEQN